MMQPITLLPYKLAVSEFRDSEDTEGEKIYYTEIRSINPDSPYEVLCYAQCDNPTQRDVIACVADSQYIVKACNGYHETVELLQEIMTLTDDPTITEKIRTHLIKEGAIRM